jgi:hypothetical protein
MKLLNNKLSRALIKIAPVLILLVLIIHFSLVYANTSEINESIVPIKIILDYGDNEFYDANNDGVETLEGIVDFTVDAKFNINLSEENLCTRWNIFSNDTEELTAVCYGAEKSCNFVDLDPIRNSWNEEFYISYGQYGTTYKNTIDAQIIYVDYNTSIEDPYAEIYYSEIASLTAEFTELEIEVLENETNATINVLETTQGAAEIGKPVEWTQKIEVINNATESKEIEINVTIPKEAEDIIIVDKKENEIIEPETKISALENKTIEFTDDLEAEEEKEFEVKYETPAPEKIETDEIISNEKITKNITIKSEASVHYEDVLSYANIPEVKEEQVHLYWIVDGGKVDVVDDPRFNVKFYDTNDNGLIDRISWIVPQLSEQQFVIEIILITKAMHLDYNKQFIADIYDYVKAKDDYWTYAINTSEYVRVTFEQALDNTKDITIYARGNGSISVYEYEGNETVAFFDSISEEKEYKVYLKDLIGTQDTFDLKIVGSIEFDYIVDPDPQALSSDSTTSDEWRMFGRHLNHSHYTSSYAPTNISEASTITYTGLSLYSYSTPAVANGILYIAEVDNFFHALNATNISQVINKPSIYYSSDVPAIAGDYVYYNARWSHGTSNGYLYQLNASNISETIASYYLSDTNNVFLGSPAVSNGSVYIGTYADYVFYQLNASDVSKSIGIADLGWGVNCYSSPAVANGFVYVGCNDDKLYQLNATDITNIIDSYTTGGDVDSSPAVTAEYVYVGSDDDKVYQLNASNVSQLIASYTTGGDVSASPGVAHGYVYIGSTDNNFYQLNATNISQQIANYTGTADFNTPAINDLYVFVGSGTSLYQFDVNDVSILIGQVGGVQSSSVEGPIIAGGYVYLAGGTGSKLTQFGTVNPTTTLNDPIDDYHFGLSLVNITFNCSASDSAGLANISLYITNSTNERFSLNQTTNISGTSSSANWTLELAEGDYIWNCLSYDTDGNSDWAANRSMTNDTTAPTITITTPSNNAFTPDTELDVNYTVSDQNTESCWYSNDSMSFNTSLTNCSTDITDVTWTEGQHNVTIWANDTRNNVGNSSVTFTIDLTNPIFTNISNQTIEYATALGHNINASDTNLDCFSVNDSTNFQINCSGYLENNTLLGINLYYLNITINDSAGNLNSSLMWVNVSDTTAPTFTTIANQSIYDLDALGYDIEATDAHNVSCFAVNDSSFKINCSGYLENNTGLNVSQYWLNITINDSTGNKNYDLMWINVSVKPFIGLDLIYPTTTDINVTQNELFNVSVNVSCNRADCGEVNVSLYGVYENTSDVRVAFVCYNSGCSDADDLSDYLIDQGFQVTQNVYTSWTDASLNNSAFDVIVVGGNYLVGYYAFDSAADPARDAFEDEAIPTVVALDYGYTPDRLGITSTTCTTDGSDNHIIDIQSHDIMTGFSGTVGVDTTGDDICYFTAAQMTDPYTKLFAPEDAGSGNIAGFVLNAGQATTGTDPGKFVYLGFDTADTYPSANGNDSLIIKQATCWAATGSYDCAPTKLINVSTGTTPFYTNVTNPYNVTLDNSTSATITWWVNATGNTNKIGEFFVYANKTSDLSISNFTTKWNATITAGGDTTPPTVTISYPINGSSISSNLIDLNATVTDDLNTSTMSYYWFINGTINTTTVDANTTFNASDGYYNLTLLVSDNIQNGSDTSLFWLDTIVPSWTGNQTNASSMKINGNATFNITVSDSGSGLSYYIFSWNGTGTGWLNDTNGSISGGSVKLTINKSTNLSYGNAIGYVWYANDSAGNWNNSLLRTFAVQSTAPTTPNVTYPINNNQYANIPHINYTSTDADSDTITYYIYINGTFNISTTENVTQWNASGGYYNLTVSAYDGAASSANSSSIFFTLDSTPPAISFVNQTPSNGTSQSTTYVEVNVSITESNLSSVVYDWNGTNYTIYNDSLILMMNFDNVSALGESDTSIVDLSGGDDNGAVSGATWTSAGRHNGAYNFDGNDFITINDNERLDLIDNFTISLWFNANDASALGRLLNKEATSNGISDYLIYVNSNLWYFASNTPSLRSGTGSTSLINGAWYHAAVTMNSTEVTMYLNGAVDNKTSFSTPLGTSSQPIFLGRFDAEWGQYFNGEIDELRIWNRSLTADEVYQQYVSNLKKIDADSWELYVNQSYNATTGLTNGSYTYQAFASDALFNWNNTEHRTVIVDTLAPNVTITYPANNSNISSNSIDLNASATDNLASSLTFYWVINGTTNTTTMDDNSTFAAADGDYNLTLFVYDGVQNGSDTIFFTLDTSTPTINTVTVTPATGTVGDAFNITANVTYDKTIDIVIAYIQKPDENNTANITLSLTNGLYNGTWNSSGKADGTYVIDIVANNTLGNEKEKENTAAIALASYSINVSVNSSVEITENESVIINATKEVDTWLNITTSADVNASIAIAKYSDNIVSVDPTTVTELSKYIDIIVDNVTNNNISFAEMRIYYTDAEVTTANLVESTLRLYKYNGSSTVWDLISPGGVDTTLNYVWGNVSGFSTFGIFGNVVSTPSTDTTTADEGSGGGGSGAGGGGVALEVLKEGSMTLNLEYGDNFIFYIKEYKHNAVIINVDTNAVKIRILGMPTDISLNLGQTIDLDLDKNGLYDFRVTLNNITELGGLFTFTILEESRKEEPDIGAGLIPEEEPEIIQSEDFEEQKEETKSNLLRNILIWIILLIFAVGLFFVKYIDEKRQFKEKVEIPKEKPPIKRKVSPVKSVKEKIYEARITLMDFKFYDAKKIYIEIMKIYMSMSPKDQSKVYQTIKDLYRERKSAEKRAQKILQSSRSNSLKSTLHKKP